MDNAIGHVVATLRPLVAVAFLSTLTGAPTPGALSPPDPGALVPRDPSKVSLAAVGSPSRLLRTPLVAMRRLVVRCLALRGALVFSRSSRRRRVSKLWVIECRCLLHHRCHGCLLRLHALPRPCWFRSRARRRDLRRTHALMRKMMVVVALPDPDLRPTNLELMWMAGAIAMPVGVESAMMSGAPGARLLVRIMMINVWPKSPPSAIMEIARGVCLSSQPNATICTTCSLCLFVRCRVRDVL